MTDKIKLTAGTHAFLQALSPLGSYHSRAKLHVHNLEDVKVLSVGNPFILQNKDDIWVIAFENAQDPTYYSYTLSKVSPTVMNYNSPENTFFRRPLHIDVDTDLIDYLFTIFDGVVALDVGHVDVEYLLEKLDLDFHMVTRRYIPSQISVEGMDDAHLRAIIDLRSLLSYYGLGARFPVDRLVENILDGKTDIANTLYISQSPDAWELVKPLEDGTLEVRIDRDAIELFPDETWLGEVVDAIELAGFNSITYYIQEPHVDNQSSTHNKQ